MRTDTDVDSEDRQQEITGHTGISGQEEDVFSYPTLLVKRYFHIRDLSSFLYQPGRQRMPIPILPWNVETKAR